MPPTILYEDRHCLVVNKPSRLLTASDRTGDETLLGQVREYNASRQAEGKKGYVAPLHFLDRPVSGVVMFAASSKAASRLSAAFREHRVQKTYVAVVEGYPPEELLKAGRDRPVRLEDWLLKDQDANVVTVARPGSPGAKACSLDARLLRVDSGRAYVELSPKTGRSHQIRVQLASRRMPIYGDVKYGSRSPWDGMIALHALRVTFDHPVTGEPLTVSAPLPTAWDALWPKDLTLDPHV